MTPQDLLRDEGFFDEAAEVDNLQADALRYRWLRDVGSRRFDPLQYRWLKSAAECDAEIDRGMEEDT
jgi:hypothetical protein